MESRSKGWRELLFAALCLWLAPSSALAQTYDYTIYVDADAQVTTGCSESLVSGAEVRLQVTASGGASPQVLSVTQAACAGGVFAGGTTIDGGYPVGVDNGIAGTDVIELASALADLPNGNSNSLLFSIVATSAAGQDSLLSSDGSPGGPPIGVGLPPIPVPLLGLPVLIVLAMLIVLVGARVARRRALWQVAALFSLFSGVALAAHFLVDGQVGDWSGVPARATDPAGDASSGESAIDLRAFYAAIEGDQLFLRLDVTNLQDSAPVAAAGNVTTLEDQAVSVNLSGSDAENGPLGFALAAPPASGSLGAIVSTGPQSASVLYTPAADANGSDSFTYTVNDGQADSAPATITVTISPVNDAPGFTAGINQAVDEGSPAQTVAGWATAIAAGPANEASQALDFIVGNDNNALFDVQPAVSATGDLTYTPAASASGSATVSVSLHDDGGTADGGVDTSPVQTFTITLGSVNNAPSFIAGPDQDVPENAPMQVVDPWATAISAGPPDEAGQALTFNVSNDNNALFSVQPTVSPSGALSYQPAAGANGTAVVSVSLSDDGGTANGGVDTSAVQTFTITISGVNDAPSFIAGASQSVFEDAGAQVVAPWATAIAAGPPGEAGQALDFIVTANDNAALFAAGPAISPAGVLSYTPAPNANGVALITVVLHDDGGSANGGVDTSPPQTFSITVGSVNDAPAFVSGPDQVALENSGAQVVDPWATAIVAGPADEAGQSLAFSVSNDNNGLFAVQPTVSPTGALSYQPAPGATGSAVVSLSLADNGGTANGGIDSSAVQTFTITVSGVNDAPSFNVGPDQVVAEDAGAQLVDPWATGISAGPPDEAGQTVSFIVTANDNPALFSVAPAVTPAGALSYTPAADASGSASISLVVQDNGGTANGGVDTSPAQTFTITVTAAADAPVVDLNGPAAGIDFSAAFSEGGPAVAIVDAAALTVSDVDTPILASASVSIGNLSDGAAESLLATTGATAITAVYDPLTGVLALTGPDTQANFQTVLRTLRYANSSTAPNETARQITFVANDGSSNSNPAVSTVSVTGVNSIPSFSGGSPVLINEDAGAQTFVAWATAIDDNDGGLQTLNFSLTQTGGSLVFSSAPAITATGDLGFTVAPDVSGTATFDVVLSDSGSDNNTSAAQSLSITVNAVNDAPSFTAGASPSVLEDSAAQLIANWAGAISAGPGDESAQTLAFEIVSNSNPTLFSSAPTVAVNGSLGFAAAPNRSGSAVIALRLLDSGGTANGGVDASAAQNFTITVGEVNDAPSFLAGPNQAVFDDAGPQTVDPWASALSTGPAEEAGQGLSFVIDSNSAPGLFAAGPSISPSGVLTYTPATVPTGSHAATIVVHVVDNGGTANGGIDSSATQAFSIEITHANALPTLTNDPISYATVGNTQLQVAGASLPGLVAIADAQSALAKSLPVDPDGPQAPSVIAASGSSVNGGSYAIDAAGAFTYVPPAGFAGVDSFSYQVTDGNTPTPGLATGTINITVGPTVWYVNNRIDANNPAGGLGRSNDAFETLAAAETASGAGDIVFVFDADSATTPYGGGIVLKDGQRLWGEGYGLAVAGFGSLVPAGVQPRITTATTSAVSVPATAGIRTNVEIRGLNLQGSPNAVNVTATGANAVGVVIAGNTISGASAEGINVDFGATASQQVAIQNNTITATGTGIDVTRTAGTATITAFDGNRVDGSTGGSGIVVSDVVFDATPGIPINTVAGGTTAIGVAGNGVAASGMRLANVTGALGFVDLDIYADGGAALDVSGSGALNAATGTGFSIAVANGAGTLNAVGGPALVVSNASISLPLGDVRSSDSLSTGIALVNAYGGAGATAFSAVSGTLADPLVASGSAFLVNGGNGNISYPGTIASVMGHSVEIANRNNGNISLSGAISDFGRGIALTGNTGATIAFGGTLELATGLNPAFSASGGGTVTATGAGSHARTTTAVAMQVTGTTIGAAGLNFVEVSAGTATAGPANGIVLNNTGTVGSLRVIGGSAIGSGGLIRNTSGAGVSLTNTLAPSFNRMVIRSTAGHGVGGTQVAGFSLTDSTIENSGTAMGAESANIAFNSAATATENNLSGVVTITGNTLSNGYYHGIDIFNFSGTIASATISNNVITSSTTATASLGSGIRLVAFGSASTVANVTRATIADNQVLNFPSAAGIQAQGGNASPSGPAGIFGVTGSATDVIAITGNRVTGASPVTRMGTQAILAVVNGHGQGNFNVSGNGTAAEPIGNTAGTTLALSSFGLADVAATVGSGVIRSNNALGSNGIGAGTGSTFGTSDLPVLEVALTGNTISQTDGNGILVVARGATGNVMSKIQNNNVAVPLAGVRNGIRVDAGNNTSIDDRVCLNISGNTSGGTNQGGVISSGIGLRKQGTAATVNEFAINAMGATASPGVENHVGNLNPLSTTGNFGITGTDLLSATSGFSGCVLP